MWNRENKLQTVEASKLFSMNFYMENIRIEGSDELSIDFANVHDIKLDDITKLLDFQKVAILNKKKIKIESTVYIVIHYRCPRKG